jgi:hypothetical protein
MISSCRDNIWASSFEANDNGGTPRRKLKLIYAPKTENELSRHTDDELSLRRDYRNNIGPITVKFFSTYWNWNTAPNTEPDLQR